MPHILFQKKKIFYRLEGKGKPVLLLHGFGEDGNIWSEQVKALKEKYYLIIPDLPGSGRSEMLDGNCTLKDYAEAVKAIANEVIFKNENFNQFCLIGHSMGGYITLAFAEKYKGTENVVLCFFGDGAARQGILHETFNMAMLWKLPVVFICENNNYAMGTSVARTSNVLDIYKLADAYDMPGDRVDGMNPETVHDAVERAVKRAREKSGPTLLEVKTYRYKGHSMSDPAKYRSKEEMEEYKLQDPVETTLDKLKKEFKVSDKEIEAINERVKAEVDESVKFADESPFPDDDELYKDVYAQQDYSFITD